MATRTPSRSSSSVSGNVSLQLGVVVVAQHRVHRRVVAERVEQLGAHDVAAVEDHVGPRELVDRERRQAATGAGAQVRVGQHDGAHPPSVRSMLTAWTCAG